MSFSLLSLFTAGLLTFFTPCVLPIIPAYIAALAGGDIKELNRSGMHKTIFLRGVFFTIGFVSIFVLLGAAASTVGAFLRNYQQIIMLVGGILILLFSLKFLHIIHIPVLDRFMKIDDTKVSSKLSFFNALLFGAVFAAGWSPCIGPILASVLTYTASQSADVLTGVLYLSIYGAGFALPFLLTALFAGKGISFIRTFNKYLPVFEKVTGIIMLGVSVYMLSQAVGVQSTSSGSSKTAQILKSEENLPLLVEFYSENCSVCKKMDPVVNKMIQKCQGKKVEFRKIDISQPENRHYVKEYSILGVPTFVLIDQYGKDFARMVGYQTEESLYQAVATLRGEQCEGVDLLENTLPDYVPEGATCSDEQKEC